MSLKPSYAAIALALGVSKGRVSQLAKDGMPVTSIAAAVEWYAANVDQRRNPKGPHAGPTSEEAEDIWVSRARREKHEATMAEMKALQMAGALVDVSAVRRKLADAGAQIRLTLERIPDKLAARLVAESDEGAIHALIDAEIQQALDDLSRVRV